MLGAIPGRPYSSNWSYYPSRLLGAVLLVVLILVLLGQV
jgi:uncharacterized membrane protein YkgB